ncbi:MAG: hypothetical protein KatS3mg131_0720 [Candidatus Tectimicrobiota bacterium]|nr:MAG: hypothetical protein KatS3mg131_0720 [Candidatus Tectomicrobia bacterium]
MATLLDVLDAPPAAAPAPRQETPPRRRRAWWWPWRTSVPRWETVLTPDLPPLERLARDFPHLYVLAMSQ